MSERARFLLLGSGEFEPWSTEAERTALADRTGPVLVLPTACAEEGDETWKRWSRMARDHYDGIGLESEVLPLRTREDAHRADLATRVPEAAMIFFSGGNPAYLSSVLWDTPFLDAMTQAMDGGMVFAGCSAGAMVASALPVGRSPGEGRKWDRRWGVARTSGLGLLPAINLGVHWNMVPSWAPGLRSHLVRSLPASNSFVGIENRTALVGDGARWTVLGERVVDVRRDGARTRYRAGGAFETEIRETTG